MESFNETRFRQQVDAALQRVRRLLDNTRHPTYAADVSHRYDDKYVLAELVVRTGTAAAIQCLETLGLTRELLEKCAAFSKDKSVTLRLRATETCKFNREVKRDVEDPTKRVTEGMGISITKKVVTTVTEYFWDYDCDFQIIAFQGASPDSGNVVTLQGRKGVCEIVTSAKTTPRPETTVFPSIDVNITWLLNRLNSDFMVDFSIDRSDPKSCHTPRRNTDVSTALSECQRYAGWATGVSNFFRKTVFNIPSHVAHGRDLNALDNVASVFVPALPIFETGTTARTPLTTFPEGVIVAAPVADGASPVVMSPGDINTLLAEQARSLAEKFAEIDTAFPVGAGLVTGLEARLLVSCKQLIRVCQHIKDGVDYIEDMLRKGIIAAISKEITPADFTQYMVFHNRKLFKPEYEPTPFCYSIRRPDHYPEGLIAIESLGGTDSVIPQPVPTTVRHISRAPPMQFALNAATKVTFNGDRFLHAVVLHKFSDGAPAELVLAARARQFSSFVMLVGRIASATLFEPVAAIMIANKDDLKIPLMLEQIPTPKEFKDAISSLSPEQQRFCKAYRSMQLESTLFGVCVVQIKPQLEKLLKLDDDSLTKEIRLTQDLLDLMTTYNVPSDMLTYDGPETAPTHVKIEAVKGYAQAMQTMIQQSKEGEMKEQAMRTMQSQLIAAEDNSSDNSLYSEEDECEEEMVQEGRFELQAASLHQKKGFSLRGMLKGAAPRRSSMKMAEEVMERSAPVSRMRRAAPAAKQRSVSSSSSSIRAPSSSGTQQQPQAQQQQQQQPQQQPRQTSDSEPIQRTPSQSSAVVTGEDDVEIEALDVTMLPKELDARMEALDVDSSLRPTIMKAGDVWRRERAKGLLSPLEGSNLHADEQTAEKNKAFDMLDALSRSGALSIDAASLHVIVASTHCFANTVMDVLVQNNVNPIEKVERSMLIVASTVHACDVEELLSVEHADRIADLNPQLFVTEGEDQEQTGAGGK